MFDWIIPSLIILVYSLGIALMVFRHNLFPPIPSELIMPLAGFTANSVAVTAAQSSGELFYQVQSLAGLVGFTLSQLVWYYPSKILTIRRLLRLADKYGKWITVSSKDITRSIESLDHQGIKAIFIRRLLPGVRTLILIPAGIGNKLLLSFLFYTTLGSAL